MEELDSNDNVNDFIGEVSQNFPAIETIVFDKNELSFVVTYEKNKVKIRDVYWMFCKKFGNQIKVTRLSSYSSIVDNYNKKIRLYVFFRFHQVWWPTN